MNKEFLPFDLFTLEAVFMYAMFTENALPEPDSESSDEDDSADETSESSDEEGFAVEEEDNSENEQEAKSKLEVDDNYQEEEEVKSKLEVEDNSEKEEEVKSKLEVEDNSEKEEVKSKLEVEDNSEKEEDINSKQEVDDNYQEEEKNDSEQENDNYDDNSNNVEDIANAPIHINTYRISSDSGEDSDGDSNHALLINGVRGHNRQQITRDRTMCIYHKQECGRNEIYTVIADIFQDDFCTCMNKGNSVRTSKENNDSDHISVTKKLYKTNKSNVLNF